MERILDTRCLRGLHQKNDEKGSKTLSSCLSDRFMVEVATAYGTKYDDCDQDNGEKRSYLFELAELFGTSTVRIRKIFNTKGLYKTAVTLEVARLSDEGYRTDEIRKFVNNMNVENADYIQACKESVSACHGETLLTKGT